ncbi:MAG: SCP2 sterol-binding domain-containing protein [Bacillota bacterium]
MTIAEIFATMRDRVAANPAKIATLKASYQFDLAGEGGGTYHASFDNGSFDIGEGAADNPGCTVSMSAADFQAMVEGKLNPTAAFMSGKLKIKGDMGLAMKLQSLIS